MASIEQLKSQMNRANGVAMTNQFAVQLPTIGGFTGRTLNLMCKSVTMPGKQVTTKDLNIGLYNEKIVDGFLVDDVSMTFYVLNDYHTKLYFDEWRKLMVGEKRGEVGYKKDYAKRVTIHQLRKPDGTGILGQEYSKEISIGGIFNIGFDFFANSIYTVELIDAFPTTISGIELTNDPDGLVEMTVQFSYTNWEVKRDLLSTLNRGIKFDI
jgi:hypothetical protein